MNEPKQQTSKLDSPTPWRNRKQMAEHYGCSTRMIDKLMRGHVVPFVKLGRFVRFNLAECAKAMEKYKQRSALL